MALFVGWLSAIHMPAPLQALFLPLFMQDLLVYMVTMSAASAIPLVVDVSQRAGLCDILSGFVKILTPSARLFLSVTDGSKSIPLVFCFLLELFFSILLYVSIRSSVGSSSYGLYFGFMSLKMLKAVLLHLFGLRHPFSLSFLQGL